MGTWKNSRLMTFDSQNLHVKTHFNDQLVVLLRERANFYNNIATEMIPCQKPMLLNDAVAFEKVLMNPKDSQGKDITWRNAAALEGYVRRLNDVADRLAGKNRSSR
ncbi:DHC7 protein [Haematococcus lacustris]|uniref:DHC7 protein n=1 Tax=Haematococcus lacustris TaxID=44745 RepID=A0A699YY18_HAELA|nr:DHC7 protein [Haematococcus lacustris]